MPRSFVPGVITVAFFALSVAGFALLPGAYSSMGRYAAGALGLMWVFAIWGALVASVLFIIVWTVEGPIEWDVESRVGEPQAGEPIAHGQRERKVQGQATQKVAS